MKLFRRKNKLNYIRELPSAFTPDMRASLEYQADNNRERRLVTEHNERIESILRTPKEVYISNMRREEEQQQQERKKLYEYVKGKNFSLKGENGHLGFRYVTEHQADHWFTVDDNSHTYQPPHQEGVK